MRPKCLVKCSNCSKEWLKRKDTMEAWHGHCRSCASKLLCERPEIIEIQRKNGKEVMNRFWQDEKFREKIVNAAKRKGENSSSWRGGKPKCSDCGKQLSAYSAKRCNRCHTTAQIGVKRTDETRRKISESQSGSKAHAWRGGVSKIRDIVYHCVEYKLWRKKVFERDNYTCVFCGDRNYKGRGSSVNIQADHIKPWSEFPELMFDIDNGRTLCLPCHKGTDTFGWKQANRLMKKSHKLIDIPR